MKAYPITEGELGNIFGIGALATISFSAAAGLLGFAIDVSKDLALSPDASPEARGFWNAWQIGSFGLCALFLIVGGALIYWRHTVVSKIKKQTTFLGI